MRSQTIKFAKLRAVAFEAARVYSYSVFNVNSTRRSGVYGKSK